MDGPALALSLLNINWIYKVCVGKVCCAQCCGRRRKALKQKEFKGQMLELRKASDPDEIKWENLGYKQVNRKLRVFASWLSALALILVALYALLEMREKSETLTAEFDTGIVCPETVTKQQAYVDASKEPDLREGLMHCFCLRTFQTDRQNIGMTFEEFSKDESQDQTQYCYEWSKVYFNQQLLVLVSSGTLAAINVIICVIIEVISNQEKHHSENDQTIGLFSKLTIAQFINITLVVLIVNFNIY
jgi:hypothetical protein